MGKINYGIQLYTVRDALGQDFKGTVKSLAKLGYQGLEFAWNYGGMEPAELAAFLKEHKLQCCGLHTSLEKLLDPANADYAYAVALGSPCVTISLCGSLEKDLKGMVAKVTEGAKIAKGKGLVFTYHNHAQEFAKIDGAYVLDLFYQATDPALVQAEIDTYWVKKGGEDPVSYIKKYSGRIPQLHFKDMNPETGSFAELGTGCVDFPGVLEVARKGGTKWVIYEQDSTAPNAPLDSAAISAKNMLKLLKS